MASHPSRQSDSEFSTNLQGLTVPRHLAVIMDGNGRWAQAQGLPRMEGHRRGAETVERIVTESRKLGIEVLTLYSFSTENWKRPTEEINFLMDLCVEHLKSQRAKLVENNIRFRHVGRTEGLPDSVLSEMKKSIQATRNSNGMTLCLALNYGAREEILDATRRLAEQARDGELDPTTIDQETFASALCTHDLPDPDLLLRTAGEMRISNFLLWQISYAELIVTETLWPDFQTKEFHEVLQRFGDRERRFGGLEKG